METYKSTQVVYASSAKDWRKWLASNHQTVHAVWLVIHKKKSNKPSVYYAEAVDEALCFGWIDSLPNKKDTQSYYQFFSARNPKSNWSAVNIKKIARLTALNKLAPAGLNLIRIAQETGTWDALDDVENLVLPNDLEKAFKENSEALNNWNAFPAWVKRGILEWIFNAIRIGTRTKRIQQTVEKAALNLRANQYKSHTK